MSLLPTNYKLILVGGGPLLNDCVELCSKLQLDDKIKFLGLRLNVPKLMKTSDIVILSSHYEGLSL